MPPSWVEIGRVRSVAPGKRALRIVVDGPQGEALKGARWLNLVLNGKPLRLPLAAIGRAGDEWNATLGAGVSKDMAGTLRGAKVVVDEVDLPAPVEGKWNLREWVGFEVVDAQGAVLGVVGGVYATSAHGAFEMRTNDSRTVLLPAIPQVVTRLDMEAGRLVLGDYAPYMVSDAD